MTLFTPKIIRENRFAVIDIEATGVTGRDDVLQVAIVQMDYGRPGFRAMTYVRPRYPIPSSATALHGITDQKVAQAPEFKDVAPDIVGLVGERILIGYNVKAFDYPFLRRKMLELGDDWDWQRPVFDLFPWLRKLDPNKEKQKGYHQLKVAALRHGVDPGHAHDAMHDCRTVWTLFERLTKKFPELENAEVPAEPPPPPASNSQASEAAMRDALDGVYDADIPF